MLPSETLLPTVQAGIHRLSQHFLVWRRLLLSASYFSERSRCKAVRLRVGMAHSCSLFCGCFQDAGFATLIMMGLEGRRCVKATSLLTGIHSNSLQGFMEAITADRESASKPTDPWYSRSESARGNTQICQSCCAPELGAAPSACLVITPSQYEVDSFVLCSVPRADWTPCCLEFPCAGRDY